MKFMRLHWFDVGFALAIITGVFTSLIKFNPLSLLLWISLISLFLHQFEEYRYPGYFPGMMNTVMFSSKQPDRYPLNTNTALIINIFVGWLSYFLAAVFGEKALWLGIATILVSVGNFIAHTFLFNIKGKTRYNPGMLTAILLFAPIAGYFFYLLIQGNLATPTDWIVGIILGLALNFIGVLKLIDWLKDKNTKHIFPKRFLLPAK
ncbi:HXXEE domain-containing protein [Chloroflexota bacterium]